MTDKEALNKLINAAWLGTDKDREEMEEAVGIAAKAIVLKEKVDESGNITGNEVKIVINISKEVLEYIGQTNSTSMYFTPHYEAIIIQALRNHVTIE